jgi:hypothetical protein
MPGTPRASVQPWDIISKKNNSGATIPRGTVVKISAATDDLIILPAAIADAALGVVMNDILTGQWGDVQIGGLAVALAGTGGVVRGDRLTHDTAGFGRVFTAAPAGGTNNALIGVANRTQATAGQLVEIWLQRPGAMLQG